MANSSNRYQLRYTGILSMILDCSSHESIKQSLSSIYSTTEEKLLSVLSSIECNEDTDIQYLKDEIDYLVWDE
ncbi:hypothetical protein SB749_18910, partial [Brevibacterium sp. SIMBA_078]|uniref:hypothetical protein n=1 Tax=Brevibacterium sp. SIMBA_078 TaxID=3085816 RepID=UPI00397D587F